MTPQQRCDRIEAELQRLKQSYQSRSAANRPMPQSLDTAYRRAIADHEAKLRASKGLA